MIGLINSFNINIGMNTGLLPVIGISLPFVSYGGSAMIISLILVGVVESIIIRSKIRINGKDVNI